MGAQSRLPTTKKLFFEALEDRSLPSAGGLASAVVGGMPDAPAAQVASHAHHMVADSVVGSLTVTPTLSVSTVPANGDQNPYGVAFVPDGFPRNGSVKPGDILVSNFNNSNNLQGTGTTIDRITPSGNVSTFFEGEAGLGLTTALGALRRGFVLVGNLPTTDGTAATAHPGSLLVLDRNGFVVENLSNAAKIDGPWDLAINDQGSHAQVFVSNVLNGTVIRLDLRVPADGGPPVVERSTQIASGYLHRTDPAALLIGPTGLAYDAIHDVLYVASTGDNAIYSIAQARTTSHGSGKGRLVVHDSAHLHGPLGLALAPNGDLITSNGDAVNADASRPSELVEFTAQGKFVSQFSIDPSAGAAFGIALSSDDGRVRFVAVDDATNTLDIWNLGPSHNR